MQEGHEPPWGWVRCNGIRGGTGRGHGSETGARGGRVGGRAETEGWITFSLESHRVWV